MAVKTTTVPVGTDNAQSLADYGADLSETSQIIALQHRGTAVDVYLASESGKAPADCMLLTQGDFWPGPQAGGLVAINAGNLYLHVAAATENMVVLYQD